MYRNNPLVACPLLLRTVQQTTPLSPPVLYLKALTMFLVDWFYGILASLGEWLIGTE